jgi:hypothetical protein
VNKEKNTTKAVRTKKFSQSARLACSSEKAKQEPLDLWIFDKATGSGVTLVSNEKMSRRVDEKTLIAGSFPDQIAGLSKMELRRHYSAEENTHRNMLSRQKTKGAVIHPAFRTFGSFISIVGPMPARGATLDRIDNTDPEYGPGKVRWADKRTQNNNKSDTHIFHYSRTGDAYTVSRLAKLQQVSQSTIRKRLERGWSDDEIIEGKRAARPPVHLHRSVVEAAIKPTYPSIVSRTASEIAFERMAEDYRKTREETGEEAIFAPLEELNENVAPHYVTPEQYERRFRKLWPQHRPHARFEKLAASQRKLIEKIDPGYVAALRVRIIRKSQMQSEI